MEDLFKKAELRIRNMKHVDAKDLALQTIIPLMRHMFRENAKALAIADGNFQNIFMSLNLVDEHTSFLDTTFAHITTLHQFVDELLLVTGLMTQKEGELGLVPTENMPSNITEKLVALQEQGHLWFEQYEAVLSATQDSLDDDDDDDDDDDYDDYEDDEDEDGDIEGTGEESAAPETPAPGVVEAAQTTPSTSEDAANA